MGGTKKCFADFIELREKLASVVVNKLEFPSKTM